MIHAINQEHTAVLGVGTSFTLSNPKGPPRYGIPPKGRGKRPPLPFLTPLTEFALRRQRSFFRFLPAPCAVLPAPKYCVTSIWAKTAYLCYVGGKFEIQKSCEMQTIYSITQSN